MSLPDFCVPPPLMLFYVVMVLEQGTELFAVELILNFSRIELQAT